MLLGLDRLGNQILRRVGKRNSCCLHGVGIWRLSGDSYGIVVIAGGVWKVDSLTGHRPTDHSLPGVSRAGDTLSSRHVSSPHEMCATTEM